VTRRTRGRPRKKKSALLAAQFVSLVWMYQAFREEMHRRRVTLNEIFRGLASANARGSSGLPPPFAAVSAMALKKAWDRIPKEIKDSPQNFGRKHYY
jgi:hypothetical protein